MSIKFHGITLIRNGNKLGYPYKLVINNLKQFCDKVWINVDPSSSDKTMEDVYELGCNIVESTWDMSKTDQGRELSRQANLLLNFIPKNDWIFYLQADEIIHPIWGNRIKDLIIEMEKSNDLYSAIELYRAYFWQDLKTIRDEWSMYLARIFKSGEAEVFEDGMSINRLKDTGRVWRPLFAEFLQYLDLPSPAPFIYHYSRLGDPNLISKRISVLDSLFHPKETIPENPPPYEFITKSFDCYSSEENPPKVNHSFHNFSGVHPDGVTEFYDSLKGYL